MEGLARILLALLALALAIQYLKAGPGGPTRWVRAKFLGKTG